jgi:hypothetical protein
MDIPGWGSVSGRLVGGCFAQTKAGPILRDTLGALPAVELRIPPRGRTERTP